MARLFSSRLFGLYVFSLVLFFQIATTNCFRIPWTCRIPTPKGVPLPDCNPKCRCTEAWANCSDNRGSLLYVPKLPTSIRFLDMSYDNLTKIPGDFFANVTYLTSVSFSTNFIANISDGAFGALERLEVLFMDNNFNLTKTVLEPVFEGKTLKCIDFRHGKLHALPETLYRTSSLEQLFLHDNYLGDLNLSRFEALPRLHLLDLAGNYVSKIAPGRMKKLGTWDLSNNQVHDFPETCIAAGPASFFPSLTTLNLKNNKLHTIRSPVCLPELRDLDISGNSFQNLQPHSFSPDLFPLLTNLYIESMQGHLRHIDGRAFQNPHLQKISLMYNNLQFSDEESISHDIFVGCPSITTLQLSSNVFSRVTDERFFHLFRNLTSLNNLYLGKVALEKIPVRTFANFPNLKKLFMYFNSVRMIPDGAFAGNPHLAELNVNDNQLTTVKPTTFTSENLGRLERIDLSGNPFICDCELRWFSGWFVAHKKTFSHSRDSYSCSNLPLKVAAFTMPDQACLLAPGKSEFIVVSVCIVIIAGTLISSVFHFRWHIRLLLYEAFAGKGDARRRRLEAGNFDYDVFVSYDANDFPWVREHLMPELEDRHGLRLCIHQRDFIPGKNIVDNIADCVERSKKILMVFSRDFVRSQWCQFELNFCLNHVITNNDVLLIVCLGDVASRHLTSSMMAVMKTTVYIQWIPGEQNAIASFWGRLKIALQEIIPRGEC